MLKPLSMRPTMGVQHAQLLMAHGLNGATAARGIACDLPGSPHTPAMSVDGDRRRGRGQELPKGVPKLYFSLLNIKYRVPTTVNQSLVDHQLSEAAGQPPTTTAGSGPGLYFI